ncbi:MAG: aminotransferase [Actinomycetota bacterium]
MHIEPFGVEMWMDEWETRCELNLAETCVRSLTIAELLHLTDRSPDALHELLDLKLTYGDITGSPRLRTAIAALYTDRSPDDVVLTHGTIGANMLVHRAMVSPGDRVIAVVPTYQQHYSIPESIGADVHQLWLRPEQQWLPDLDELRRLTAEGARMIALTNPNNPTGALIEQPMLEEIAQIADDAGAWVLGDEVYRGTDETGGGSTASIIDVYERGISTASMSKAYSLAGLRLGWVAAPPSVIEAVTVHRDYDTISVGMIDDYFACLALEHGETLLERSRALTERNRAILDDWIANEPRISWIRPKSGTTALLKYDLDVASRDLCVELLESKSVMFCPGSALGIEGCLRIGYANDTEVLVEGLARFGEFLAGHSSVRAAT